MSLSSPNAHCTFLGCRIERKQIRWSKAAMEEYRAEVRRLTGRTWGVFMEHRLGSLSRYVQAGSATRFTLFTKIRRNFRIIE
jgi:hypothetical protein